MDKISVIIPVYKAEKYLNRCLESIVNQTYKNLEIIVMDDDSPDNCPQMCDSWALSDERIKVFHIENKGAANARNKALEIASGKYIAFADSDDYTEPEFIERLYKISLKNNSDISVCGYFDNEGTNKEKYEDFNVDKKEAMKKIALGDYVFGVLWNKLYRADVIKNIKMPDFVCCEDLVFNYYAFKKSDSISQTNEKLYHYMQNECSITSREFNYGSLGAVYAKQLILENEKGSELEDYAVRGLVVSSFVALSGIVSSGNCKDKYDFVRNIILKYKKDIFTSRLYSKRDKLKTAVLMFSKKLYNKFI